MSRLRDGHPHMNRDPQAWARLGKLLRDTRERRGASREEVAGQLGMSAKTIQNFESGRVPNRDRIPPNLAKLVTAMGYTADSIERVLGGDDPVPVAPEGPVKAEAAAEPASPSVTAAVLFPSVIAFGRLCVREGGDPKLRDELEEATERLFRSVPGRERQVALSAGDVGLAAYRPHAPGEGVPADDAERIRRAIEGR